jgi:hypothetical protein
MPKLLPTTSQPEMPKRAFISSQRLTSGTGQSTRQPASLKIASWIRGNIMTVFSFYSLPHSFPGRIDTHHWLRHN